MEQAVIDIVEVVIRVRDRSLLRGVSIDVMPGEIASVFGPLGSGKSSLLRAAAGLMALDSGSIRIFGTQVTKRNSRVELAPDSHSGTTPHQWLTRRAAAVPSAQRAARITRALEALDLFKVRDTPIRELGEGTQRAVALAAAFASPARVLLIDGLLDGLPAPLFERAWSHLRNRAHKEDGAILIATVRSEIAELADRTLILDSGRPLAYARPSELLAVCAADSVTIEAVDATLVQGTLRGIFDIEIEESNDGARFAAADGAYAAAQVFRHPPAGARTVYVRKATLWDVHKHLLEEELRADRTSSDP